MLYYFIEVSKAHTGTGRASDRAGQLSRWMMCRSDLDEGSAGLREILVHTSLLYPGGRLE